MRRSIIALTAAALLLGAAPPASEILPTDRFDANFLNFPQAWTAGVGKGVRVVVVGGGTAGPDAAALIGKLAPGARVEPTVMADFLGAGPLLPEKPAPKTAMPEVILLMERPSDADLEAALRAVGRLSRSGASVVLPAWFGPMENAPEDDPRIAFVRAASAAGAAVVGAHGRAYQIGHLDFWKKIPVDTFALHVRVDGDDSSRPDALIDRPLESPAPLAAAAVALLRAAERTLTPAQVKENLRERGRQVVWTRVAFTREGGGTAERVIASRSLAAFDRRFGAGRGLKAVERFAASTLDAGLLLGLPPMAGGEWSRSVLRAAEARRKATGKGITVAILDHMFDGKDAAVAGKWVKPGSVIEGLPAFGEDGSGHGTWMARDLLSVAPGVDVMPVRVCGPGHEGTAEDYAKGIDYAVANGARIVSLSHRPIEPAKQAVLDEAVDRASRAGVTFVYIHYQGTRSDVVVPGPVEFAAFDEGRAMVYVVGTNFIDDGSFPYTWGLSPTAPIVSGVAAMMLEVNPELTPAEIRAVLLGSGRDIGSGPRVLDAAQAVRTAAASTRKR